MSRLRTLAATLAALGLSLANVVTASAEAYPTRPIKIIVPTPAGGPVDVIARLIGNYLASSLGQAVVIDNRPGAGNTIGSKEAAQAEPDGYTLLYSSASARERICRVCLDQLDWALGASAHAARGDRQAQRSNQ